MNSRMRGLPLLGGELEIIGFREKGAGI